MTEIFFPDEDFRSLKIFAKDGKVRLEAGKIHTISGTW
jgi:hypothetical protein